VATGSPGLPTSLCGFHLMATATVQFPDVFRLPPCQGVIPGDFHPSTGCVNNIFEQSTDGSSRKPFTIAFPVSQDPFKRPENDRVKALRFTASIVPEELSGLTPPCCPTAPTLWRHNIDEVEPDAGAVESRSPLWKSLLSSSLSSSETTKVCTLTFNKTFSVVTKSYELTLKC
jgi:hypothetical protein